MKTNEISLTLHPGGSKSGSTYLQSFFLKNVDQLAGQELAYWHNFRDLPFAELAKNGDSADFSRRVLEGVEADTAHYRWSKLLLSYENVFGEPLLDEGLYAQAPQVANYTKHFLSAFKETKIVYVIRRLDEFLLSQYNQRKKQGAKMTFSGFSALCERRGYRNAKIIEALEVYKSVADIVIIEFELLRKRPRRFCGDFLAECGVKLDSTFTFEGVNSNPSVNQDGIKILEFAKDFLSKGDYMALRKFTQTRMPKRGYGEEESKFLEHWRNIADDDYAHFLQQTGKFARIIGAPADTDRNKSKAS